MERGYVASADALRHMGAGDWPATREASLDGHRRRRALRRPRPGRARAHRPRARADRGGARRGGARAAGRGDGGGGRRRAVARRHRASSTAASSRGATRRTSWRGPGSGRPPWRTGARGSPTWCPFTGTCLLHRAEILQVHGDWDEALAEARLACDRFAAPPDRRAAGEASYRCGEILRIRGDLARGRARLPRRQPQRARPPARPRAPAARAGTRRRGVRRRRRGRSTRPPAWVERARLLPASRRDPAGGRAARRRHRGRRRARRDRAPPRPDDAARRRRPGARRRRPRRRRRADGGAAAARGGRALARARARRTRRRGRACWWPRRAGRWGTTRRPRMELAAAREELARLGAAAGRARGGGEGLTARELQVLRRLATGETQQGDRRRPGREPPHGRPARQQPLRQAAGLVARRGDGLGLRARPHLRAGMGRMTHRRTAARMGDPADARGASGPRRSQDGGASRRGGAR